MNNRTTSDLSAKETQAKKIDDINEIQQKVLDPNSKTHPIALRIEKAKDYKASKLGHKISWSALAQEIGLTATAPTNWKKGKISRENLEKIAEYTGVDFTWLVTGDGEMLRYVNTGRTVLGYTSGMAAGAVGVAAIAGTVTAGPIGLVVGSAVATAFDAFGRKLQERRLKSALEELDNNPELVEELKKDVVSEVGEKLEENLRNTPRLANSRIRFVPIISYSQVGNFKEAIQDVREDFVVSSAENLGEHAFALEIKDESMLEDFKPGDKSIIDPGVQPVPGDCVISHDGHDEAPLRVYKPRGFDDQGREYFELVPLNPMYPTLDSRFQKIEIIGTVVEHIRTLVRRKT